MQLTIPTCIVKSWLFCPIKFFSKCIMQKYRLNYTKMECSKILPLFYSCEFLVSFFCHFLPSKANFNDALNKSKLEICDTWNKNYVLAWLLLVGNYTILDTLFSQLYSYCCMISSCTIRRFDLLRYMYPICSPVIIHLFCLYTSKLMFPSTQCDCYCCNCTISIFVLWKGAIRP